MEEQYGTDDARYWINKYLAEQKQELSRLIALDQQAEAQEELEEQRQMELSKSRIEGYDKLNEEFCNFDKE